MKYIDSFKESVLFFRSKGFWKFALLYLIFESFIYFAIFAAFSVFQLNQMFLFITKYLYQAKDLTTFKQVFPMIVSISTVGSFTLISLIFFWIFRQGVLIREIYKKRYGLKEFGIDLLFTLISLGIALAFAYVFVKVFPVNLRVISSAKIGVTSSIYIFFLILLFNSHFYFVAVLNKVKKSFSNYGLYFKTFIYLLLPLAVEMGIVYLFNYIPFKWLSLILYFIVDIFFVIYDAYLGYYLVPRRLRK